MHLGYNVNRAREGEEVSNIEPHKNDPAAVTPSTHLCHPNCTLNLTLAAKYRLALPGMTQLQSSTLKKYILYVWKDMYQS